MLETAEKAADVLAADGIDVTVWDARCCAPLDPEMIADASTHDRVITIEDGIRDGGIGMAIGDAVCTLRTDTEVTILGLPTKFIRTIRSRRRSSPGSGSTSTASCALVRGT